MQGNFFFARFGDWNCEGIQRKVKLNVSLPTPELLALQCTSAIVIRIMTVMMVMLMMITMMAMAIMTLRII